MSEDKTKKFKLVTDKGEKELESNVPQIIHPPEFENLDPQRKVVYLKKLSSSLNDALDKMQKERNEGLEIITKQQENLENIEKALEINKDIMRKNITDSNEQNSKHIKTIQELQQRVKTQDEVIARLNEK